MPSCHAILDFRARRQRRQHRAKSSIHRSGSDLGSLLDDVHSTRWHATRKEPAGRALPRLGLTDQPRAGGFADQSRAHRTLQINRQVVLLLAKVLP
jgi:hypothetical protein